MRISDWSSDVCSSDLLRLFVLLIIFFAELEDHLVDADIELGLVVGRTRDDQRRARLVDQDRIDLVDDAEVEFAVDHLLTVELHIVAEVIEAELVVRRIGDVAVIRSEEHTSELQSLMRISYAVFCLTKKK